MKTSHFVFLIVLLLFGAAGCYRDASSNEARPTSASVGVQQINRPSPTVSPSATFLAVPTFTPQSEVNATKTLAVGGPNVETTAEITPSDAPPVIVPSATDDDVVAPPGLSDTGITPTLAPTLTETFVPGLPTPTSIPAPDKCIHVVQGGDTLFRIAFDNNLTPEDFYPVNPELAANPNSLYIGQEIRIPNCVSDTPTPDPNTGNSSQPPASTGTLQHVVQQGDTLFSIARRYGVTVDAIVSANGLPSADTIIRVGDVLAIPAP